MTTADIQEKLSDAIVSADNPEILYGFRRSAIHVDFLKKTATYLSELETENSKLREALKPFADFGRLLDDKRSRHGLNLVPEFHNGELYFVVGDGTAASLYRSQFGKAFILI